MYFASLFLVLIGLLILYEARVFDLFILIAYVKFCKSTLQRLTKVKYDMKSLGINASSIGCRCKGSTSGGDKKKSESQLKRESRGYTTILPTTCL